MDEGIKVGMGRSILSNAGPYIPCLFGVGKGHGGEPGVVLWRSVREYSIITFRGNHSSSRGL